MSAEAGGVQMGEDRGARAEGERISQEGDWRLG